MILFFIFIGWIMVFSLWRGKNLSPRVLFKLPLLRLLFIVLIFFAALAWMIFAGLKALILMLLYALPAALICCVLQNIYFYFQKKS